MPDGRIQVTGQLASAPGRSRIELSEALLDARSATVVMEDGSSRRENIIPVVEQMLRADPGTFDNASVQALYILHELGHVLGGFRDDTNERNLSEEFSRDVWSNCL
jgi:hypothetical protein